jgi:hypothetical protein
LGGLELKSMAGEKIPGHHLRFEFGDGKGVAGAARQIFDSQVDSAKMKKAATHRQASKNEKQPTGDHDRQGSQRCDASRNNAFSVID